MIKKLISIIQCKRYGISFCNGMFLHPFFRVIGEHRISLSECVVLHSNVLIDCGKNGQVVCEKGVNINSNTRIESMEKVWIKKNVLIGPYVYISDRNHEYRNITQPIMKQGYYSKGEIVIEEGTWIGIHAVIIGNVHIGRNCVIGANAVVTKNIPDFSIVVGNPAIIIKRYNLDSQQWERNSSF